MKKIILIVLTIFLFNTNMVFASDNFSNPDWWKTATVEDVKREIENGADVNAKDSEGGNALMYAVASNSNPEVLKKLIDAGADVNSYIDSDPVYIPILIMAIEQGNAIITKILLDSGANVNAKVTVKEDVLKMSASTSNSTINKMTKMIQEMDGKTPLVFAIAAGNIEIIKILINAGANVNASYGGLTPLMMSLSHNNPEIIKILVDAGADVNAKAKTEDIAGLTVLDIAKERLNNPEIIKILTDAKAKSSDIINSTPKYENKNSGLEGVVINSEVPQGRARCGIAEQTQGCVLYIMNPHRSTHSASDFFPLAAKLTGREKYIIETGNMTYSHTKIRPGEIAQINIPPLQ